MAIRIAMNVICDRCLKPYEQKNLEYGEAVPKVERKKLIILREGDPNPKTGEVPQEVVLAYQDLCSQCEGVVDKAISRIKMDASAPPPAKKKRNGVKTSVKEEAKTSTEPEAAPQAEPEAKPEAKVPSDDDTPEEEEPLF